MDSANYRRTLICEIFRLFIVRWFVVDKTNGAIKKSAELSTAVRYCAITWQINLRFSVGRCRNLHMNIIINFKCSHRRRSWLILSGLLPLMIFLQGSSNFVVFYNFSIRGQEHSSESFVNHNSLIVIA